MQMQAHQKLQELQKDDYKNDLPQQSFQDNELAKNSVADFNSTTDGVVQPKGLGSIIINDDFKNNNQKNDEMTITDQRENKHSSQQQESCID